MLVMTQRNADMVWFEFSPAYGAQPVRVEWSIEDKAQLFPEQLARTLLRKGFANMPTEAHLDWLELVHAPVVEQPVDLGPTADAQQASEPASTETTEPPTQTEPPKEPSPAAKSEEPTKEEAKSEEPTKEEAKAEEPAKEEAKVEEPAKEEAKGTDKAPAKDASKAKK